MNILRRNLITAYITSHIVARDVTAVDPITFPTISFRHFIPTALLFKYIHSYSLPILFRSFFFIEGYDSTALSAKHLILQKYGIRFKELESHPDIRVPDSQQKAVC